MKILEVCPLWFPVSRDAPGGRETLLAYLIDTLESLNCEITFIASGDSTSQGELVPVVPGNLYDAMIAGDVKEYIYYEQQQLRIAFERATQFDVVHSHVGAGAFVLSAIPGLRERVLHTIHTPVYQDLQWFVGQHPGMWLSTVSAFQARKLRQHGASHCRVIHNGIDTQEFNFQHDRGPGLLFLGRIEWAKGPDLSIKTAQTLNQPLTLAGPIIEPEYFKQSIEPFLDEQIQYVGVVDHDRKNALFGGAGCVLMPSRWAEPFGIVAVEAMACGTPVVALSNGALPEIIEPGLTGYVTHEEAELPGLVHQALKLDRAEVRARAVARFDIRSIAEKYLDLYSQIVA